MCKRGDTFSLQVLIGRGLFLFLLVRSLSFILLLLFFFQFSLIGAYGSEVTPVPIPNTEVKLVYVDDTWLATAWESKKVPVLNERKLIFFSFRLILFFSPLFGPLAQLVRASGS